MKVKYRIFNKDKDEKKSEYESVASQRADGFKRMVSCTAAVLAMTAVIASSTVGCTKGAEKPTEVSTSANQNNSVDSPDMTANTTEADEPRNVYKEEKISGDFGKPVFTVFGEDVYEAEFRYYYVLIVYELYNYIQNYSGDVLGLDTSKQLDEQEYNGFFGDIPGYDKSGKPTWGDYVAYIAKDRIVMAHSIVKKAQQEGFGFTDDQQKELEFDLLCSKESLMPMSSDESKTYEDMFKSRYGEHMTEELFTLLSTRHALINAYEEKYKEDAVSKISDSEVEQYYSENEDKCGNVSFRMYAVSVDSAAKDQNAEMKEARKIAEKIAAAKDEKEFLSLVSEAEKKAGNENYKDYLENDNLTLVKEGNYWSIPGSADEEFGKWMFGKNTAKNSTYIAEDEGYGCVVYLMVEPIHKAKQTETFDMRLIHFKFSQNEENASADKFDFEKNGVFSNFSTDSVKNTEACNKAVSALKTYLDTDKSEWSFAKIALEQSEDSSTKSSGGLFQNMAKGSLGDEFDSFCLSKDRKKGDVKIIEVSNDSYKAYQIIYFIGNKTATWQSGVRDEIAAESYQKFVQQAKKNADASKLDEAVLEEMVKNLTESGS